MFKKFVAFLYWRPLFEGTCVRKREECVSLLCAAEMHILGKCLCLSHVNYGKIPLLSTDRQHQIRAHEGFLSAVKDVIRSNFIVNNKINNHFIKLHDQHFPNKEQLLCLNNPLPCIFTLQEKIALYYATFTSRPTDMTETSYIRCPCTASKKLNQKLLVHT